MLKSKSKIVEEWVMKVYSVNILNNYSLILNTDE